MIILGAWAALRQGAADSVPVVKAWLREAYKVGFEKVNLTAAHTLSHGWFEAGKTVMMVAPMWECYLLCRLGCAQFVWWWLLVYAVVFCATLPLPISRWWIVLVSLVMLRVLSCCDAPWQWHLLICLGNVKLSSRLLGARLELLWWEARTLSERLPKLMKLDVKIREKTMEYFNLLRAKSVCTVIHTIKTFAKMSHLFDEDLRRNPNTFAWTKLLCFSHVAIPLTKMRVIVIVCLELLWLCAWNLAPAAVALLGFQPTLAGMFGVGGRATQATDELLAALAADDALINA
jgi:hypothetical protein